jgi:ribonuclease HI
MSKIVAYTDGSSIDNPGPSGIGVYLIKEENGKTKTKQYKKGFIHATNNQMELLACLVPFRLVKDPDVIIEVRTDSEYAINSVTNWSDAWAKNNWKKASGATVKNRDLIEPLKALFDAGRLIMTKVKAHSGIEGNELADSLAKEASGNKKGQIGLDSYIRDTKSAISF